MPISLKSVLVLRRHHLRDREYKRNERQNSYCPYGSIMPILDVRQWSMPLLEPFVGGHV